MSRADFPGRIFAADMAPAGSEQAEIVYTEDADAVAGLPCRVYLPAPQIDWERLARLEAHWIRVSILELLTVGGARVLSAEEMAFELQEPFANTSSHVTALAKAGFLELVTTEKSRGATKHYYRLARQGGG